MWVYLERKCRGSSRSRFSERGHEVKIGTRNPAGSKGRRYTQKRWSAASMGTFAKAATFGEIVVVASLCDSNSKCLKMAAWGISEQGCD